MDLGNAQNQHNALEEEKKMSNTFGSVGISPMQPYPFSDDEMPGKINGHGRQ